MSGVSLTRLWYTKKVVGRRERVQAACPERGGMSTEVGPRGPLEEAAEMAPKRPHLAP